MKNKKNWAIFLPIVLLLQLAAEILSVVVVLQLNMLPGKYIAVFIPVMVLLAVLTGLLAFVKVKGKVAAWRKIVSGILALLILCGCALISKVAIDARRIVNDVAGSGELLSARNTYVLVLNEDPAQSLADTKGYSYGAMENYDVEHTQQMINAIEQETAESIALTYYQQTSAMVDALYSKEVSALIMSGANISLLIEQEDYEDFLTRTRILYMLAYENTVTPEETTKVEEVVTTPFIVYISGSDTRSSTLDVGGSDVNILAAVNPQAKQVLLLNTPRDYFIPNPAGNGALDKLTHCGRYGIDCSVEALEGLYGIQVDYYGQINFAGFEALIDAIGGITFNSDKAFQARNTYIKVGDNQLTGAQALDVARERYHVSGGDNGRGKNQMKMIKAVIEKVTSSTTLISNYAGILNSLEGMAVTSFRTEEISALVKMQLSDMATWNVQTFAVVGSNGNEENYSYPGEVLSVMWPNEEVVAYASALVERVLDGETLTQDDMTMP